MSLKYFSPKWFFQDKLKLEEIQKIEILFSDYINDNNNFEFPPNWGCDVKSSLYIDSNEDPIWGELFNIITPYLINFVNSCNPKRTVDILPVEVWVNKYDFGNFQEQHDHCSRNSNISMVYFHKLNEDDNCSFQFYNEQQQFYKQSGLSEIFDVDSLEYSFIPDIEQGSIIFFPSHYIHSVSTHKGTKTRITFSANLNCV
jgi:hypothetical protein